MNVENLARQAINIIKNKWGLPKSGFLAGGSIANIIWELVSGNVAIVNDLDIFIFDGIKQKFDSKEKNILFNYHKTETKYYEDYTGLCFTNRTKEFYSIVEAERDGIFNNIKYKSNIKDPSLIIRSFDINATKVGYNIDEDKIYWTPEFEEFLQTGELKVCNLVTPCHSAVRIAKKSKELNAKLNPFEFKLLQYSLTRGFSDKLKWRFKEKYFEMFNSNKDLLSNFFYIKRDKDTELYVKEQFGEEVQLYFLDPKIANDPPVALNDNTVNIDIESVNNRVNSSQIFDDKNLNSIYTTHDFLFYMRNIWGSEKLKELWSKLNYFFVSDNYVDGDFNLEDIELLRRFSSYAPNSIENLKGMKLSEQIGIIKMFLDKFKDDPIVAISILENTKVDKEIILDDETALLLELSVRKNIHNDTRNKVGRILYDHHNPKIDTINF